MRGLVRRTVWLSLICFVIFCAAGAAGVNALSAASAVLFEPDSGKLLVEKDAHRQRTMASTTKIMTALVAIESGDLSREITIDPEAVRVEGSALGLRGGDKITMRDLVTGMMLVSGNDAANAVAFAVSGGLPAFAERMNARAAEIGMKNTCFVTPSGLDAQGHMSTAYDMALLAAEAMKNEAFAEICAKKTATIRFGNPPVKVQVSNHNRLLKLYDSAVGIKTGFTKKSGRCLVSAAKKDGILLIAVTLNAGDDWNDHMSLYNQGFTMVKHVQLKAPALPEIPVVGGLQPSAGLYTVQPPSKIILSEEESGLSVKIELPAFIFAPVTKDDVVGRIQYSARGKVLFTSDIYVRDSVDARPEAGYAEKLMDWWRALFRALIY